MDHRVGPVEDPVQQAGVEDRPFDELDIVERLEVGAVSGREIVEGHHVGDVGIGAEGTAQVGADEAGATGDDDPHRRPISLGVRKGCPADGNGSDLMARCTGAGYNRSTVGPSSRLRVSST